MAERGWPRFKEGRYGEAVCDLCGARLYKTNTLGVCSRTEACKKELRHRYQQTDGGRRSNSASHRRFMLERRYGISEQIYDLLLESQDGVCWLCGEPPADRRLEVEHDHSCSQGHLSEDACSYCIRSLCCNRCNRLVGIVEASPEMLRDRFADYWDRRPVLGLVAA